MEVGVLLEEVDTRGSRRAGRVRREMGFSAEARGRSVIDDIEGRVRVEGLDPEGAVTGRSVSTRG